MSKNVIVIGGGIIGLCSAYYLSKEGHRVTVIDKSDITSGASFVNAGYLTPSHIIPIASPGMIAKGIKWMFNSSSPFYMKPRFDLDFFKWSWYFHRASTNEKVERAIPVIKDINLLSRDLFEDLKSSNDLGDFQLERKGLLMLYKTDAAGEEEMTVAEKAKYLGLEVSLLNKQQLDAIEPNVEIDAKGAIHYKCDRHMTPTEFMPKMLEYLKEKSVSIKTNEEILDITLSGSNISEIKTAKGTYTADEVILAAGSWSGIISKKLNIKLPIQAGKGYRVNVDRPTGINLPAILLEAKVAVTPMKGFTRFAGTMEFSGINSIIKKERVKAIGNAARDFYPEITISQDELEDAKSGMRPVSPDGLPYIGKCDTINNLTFATGHAMMGWSLGPATGKLVSEIVNNKKTSLDISAFAPHRKF
ncbi:NAD(P)/FAD-dependent oxidoreductase [Maribacter sp. HTCC2170]|uniref:NAD(P)/FAD-dependent oxidoreductase n=1 Tax=Maribacter sp. (strain HTCC2170 / KCCM 42371) TaxID=313603 RepID=UPI00006AFC53|nr:FAD-dependent oxidoreductase [Maribacter sp. HTCC2170]EAR01167.1 D-amino acid dehydrogenase [Maribacter sp. HTCC2170]